MDNLTIEQRRKNMQAIRSKDTKVEIILRKALWKKGYRFRKNYKRLIGKPDIVFTKKRVAIFCDGDFFHGYDWKRMKKNIKSNRDYWIPKIETNMERDKRISQKLTKQGWKVLRFWEREINENLENCIKRIEDEFE